MSALHSSEQAAILAGEAGLVRVNINAHWLIADQAFYSHITATLLDKRTVRGRG